MANDAREKRPMARIGGLWKKKISGTDKTYLSGTLGQAVFFVFPQDKVKPTDPDYAMFVAPNEQREDDTKGSATGRRRREPGEDL